MSKIDKLSILGVRSFGNAHPENIQFHTPLTLIVGYNGSGKTTIIECLKYATTGDLPPNSKGGAFIHDPKLCGEKEVLAQVRLQFKSTSGAKMVVTRNIQLTVKKTTRQQKTLEGQLLMIKDGERTAISSRVAELDQILPQYLGVSKAILDSVIFCHQDESLWPMSEPSALKKRFDEIFEALKYTKAIDNIKALRKKQNEDLGKYKIMEQHAKEDKDKGERAERRSNELAADIEVLRAETKDLQVQTKESEEKAQEAFDHAAKYKEIVALLEVKRKEQDIYQKNMRDLKQGLKERKESDDWLENELDQYEERMTIQEERQKQQGGRYSALQAEIEQARQQQRSKDIEAGKYEEQKTNHEQQIKRRSLLIKETARRHNIRGFETDLDDLQIREYLERITKLCKDQNAHVERARRETDKEVQKAQEMLSNLGERRSALNDRKNSTRQQMTSNDQKLALAQSELNTIEIDEGGKALLESNIEDVQGRLRKARDELTAGGLDTKIQEGNVQLRSLEDESEQLNRELVQGTKQAGDLARLDHLKKELKDRKRGLDTLNGAHGERLRKIVGSQWQAPTLEGEYQKVLDARRSRSQDAKRQQDGATRELDQANEKLGKIRTDLKKDEKELDNCAKKIREATYGEPDEYLDDIANYHRNRDEKRTEVDQWVVYRDYYTGSIEIAKKNDCCRLCTRRFRAEGERAAFLERLEAQITKASLEVAQKELKDIEKELKTAQDAGHYHDTWLRLKDVEIPRLRAELKLCEKQREDLITKVEEHDKLVSDYEESKIDAETLAKPVVNIAKYSQDVVSYQNQIQELTALQKDSGMSRTLEDIQEQLESTSTKARTLRGHIGKMTADKERIRGQISALELDLSKAKNNLMSANYQFEKRGNILRQVEDLKKLNHDHRAMMKQLDGQIQELAPKIAEEEAKLDDIRQRGSSKERELQQEASKLSDSVHKLELANQDIRAYIDGGGPANLARCRREIQNAQETIVQLEIEQRLVTVEINKLREELRNHDQTKRVIIDNLKFRRALRDLEEVKSKIAELSGQNAEADLRHYWDEGNRWQQRHKMLHSEETSKMATMKAKDDQLAQLLKDWETDYKGAAFKFKESHIRVEVTQSDPTLLELANKSKTTKAAVEDLGRYGSALDKAIMKYHSIKMDEINRLIEELWRKTYQGTDVDTILIRSDNETGKGNRSYNYRVCMVKQDAEMDMRGRCSAGQKVLACIIIRLALAECFGTNCGLIALDEPTTNLDRDNIRSLAESLHDIIRQRQQQSNFQLIVITHDEEFLRYMKCADFCDQYYRVSRNDGQKSIIQRQSIAEVMS